METEVAVQTQRIKRVDMGFLDMKLPNGLPRFAILGWDAYRRGWCCAISVEGPDHQGKTNINMPSRYTTMWTPPQGLPHWNGVKVFTAEPSSAVPEEIVRRVETLAPRYTNIKVAWEATWREAPPMPEPNDPIVIGERDGRSWILATWDLTKLESYVCAEFVED